MLSPPFITNISNRCVNKLQTGKFIKNAAVLTVTALVLRSIGMFFRIWLSSAIGAEGMGLYTLILSVYMLASTFATSGISTAVTRLIAEELTCGTARSVKRIFARSVILTLCVAAFSTAAVFFLSDIIADLWIKDARATLSLKILSFSLPFMGVSSCIRGYFIACRRVVVQSSAQIFEQLVRIGLIMSIIGIFAPFGIGYASAAVLIGDTVAEAASCLFLYIGYRSHSRKLADVSGGRKSPPYSVVARLTSIALPITAGRYLTTALRTAESLLVPSKLARYSGSYSDSLAAFGRLKGMALPILFFPGSFLTALSTLLVPEMSSAAASGDRELIRSASRRTIGITCELSAIIAGVFLVFSGEIGVVAYGSVEVGVLIRCLAPLVPLMYLESVTDGILKGLGQEKELFKYNLADSAVRLILIYLAVERFGMVGFLTVMVVSNALTASLCIGRLLIRAEMGFDLINWAVRPIICAVLSSAAAFFLAEAVGVSGSAIRLVVGGVVAVVTYAATMYYTGGFRELIPRTKQKTALHKTATSRKTTACRHHLF